MSEGVKILEWLQRMTRSSIGRKSHGENGGVESRDNVVVVRGGAAF